MGRSHLQSPAPDQWILPCRLPAVPAQWYMGEAAKKELGAATRVKGSDEAPPASSYEAVEEPPEVWQHDYGERQRLGWLHWDADA